MNETIQELGKTKWYRMLKVIYVFLLMTTITTSFLVGYENNGLYLWGYFFQFSLLCTFTTLVIFYIIKRIFYYIYLNTFTPEKNINKLLEHWEISSASIILLLMLINYVVWRPHNIRIECFKSTSGTIHSTENFEKRWDEEYPKFLKCLKEHNLQEEK